MPEDIAITLSKSDMQPWPRTGHQKDADGRADGFQLYTTLKSHLRKKPYLGHKSNYIA